MAGVDFYVILNPSMSAFERGPSLWDILFKGIASVLYLMYESLRRFAPTGSITLYLSSETEILVVHLQQIAMPFLNNTQVIYYNKTVAEQYGLTIPKEFNEWDAFFKEVKEKTG
ncbi:MAG: extracellular solute-binding protein, partial [Candidatus Methanomethylophilaceae archaeon]|nr:extracellular solute-binding protein [Candidatus Methanomethylophilaceae archaeon]